MCSDVYLFIYKLLCKQGGTNEELKQEERRRFDVYIFSHREGSFVLGFVNGAVYVDGAVCAEHLLFLPESRLWPLFQTGDKFDNYLVLNFAESFKEILKRKQREKEKRKFNIS